MKTVRVFFAAFVSVSGAVAASAQGIDFSEPGSLEVSRGRWSDGAGAQVSFSPYGATVSFDRARLKDGEGKYYALSVPDPGRTIWNGRRVSLFVRSGDVPAVQPALSLEFRDDEGEIFRYKPVDRVRDGEVSRLDYVLTEDGVSLKTWGRRCNGRFDGSLRLVNLLGSYVPHVERGTLTYERLVPAAEIPFARAIDAFMPISEDRTFPGPKPVPRIAETLTVSEPSAPDGRRRVARVRSTAVEALSFNVDTGDRLHLLRGTLDAPPLVFRNLSHGRRRWRGRVLFRDHFGRGFTQDVDVTAVSGAVERVEAVRRLPGKGIWHVTADLTGDDGMPGVAHARFASVDRHEVTPQLPKPFFRMGINYHAQRYWKSAEHFTNTLDALVASGAKLVRSGGFKFAEVARRRELDWTMTDAIFSALRSRGFAVNANVYPGPAWARGEMPDRLRREKYGRIMNFPSRPGLFRDFCASIAERYGTGIDYYEMGNEWDLTGRDVLPPDEALRLLREGFEGVKSSCPSATVTTCGWAGADSAAFDPAPNPGLIEMFAEKGRDAFDVWAIHLHGRFGSYAERLQSRFFPMRRRTGLDARPWYSNETAFNTSAGKEEEASRDVWKKILYAWAWGSTDYIWYTLRATGWDPDAGEDSYGLFTPDYRPRGTFAAFSALATLVHGARFDARLMDGEGMHVYRMRSADGRGLFLAGWDDAAVGEGVSLRVRTDARSARRVDLMGNAEEIPIAGGVVSWRIDRDPSALVLDGAHQSVICSPEPETAPCGIDGAPVKNEKE